MRIEKVLQELDGDWRESWAGLGRAGLTAGSFFRKEIALLQERSSLRGFVAVGTIRSNTGV